MKENGCSKAKDPQEKVGGQNRLGDSVRKRHLYRPRIIPKTESPLRWKDVGREEGEGKEGEEKGGEEEEEEGRRRKKRRRREKRGRKRGGGRR